MIYYSSRAAFLCSIQKIANCRCITTGKSSSSYRHPTFGFYNHISKQQSSLYRHAADSSDIDFRLLIADYLPLAIGHAVIFNDDFVWKHGIAISCYSACSIMVITHNFILGFILHKEWAHSSGQSLFALPNVIVHFSERHRKYSNIFRKIQEIIK